MAPPYSAAVSANVYAMVCNRSRQHCLNLYNVTLVLATEQELDYMMFMFSMFNSPLPNMRQHTRFYETDLNMTRLEMGPAQDASGMNIFNMSSSAWSILDSLFTLKPFVAGKLPLPPGAPKITDTTRAAPSVQAVTDCRDLQVALQHPSTGGRLHVWWLLNNITLAPSHDQDCWQLNDVKNPSQIYGSVDEFGQAPAVRGLLADSALGTHRSVWRPRLLAGTGSSADASRVSGFKMYSLGFSYLQAAFVLPLESPDRFLQITNVTLHQLPQGPSAPSAVSGRMMTADVWALLLWPINRTMGGGSPVYVADAVIMLPQQEFDSLSNAAVDRNSFVVQLADNLTLTIRDLVHEGPRMNLGFFQGPGIIGSNVWLLPDPASTTAMPQPYKWPFTALMMTSSTGAANSSGQSRLSEILGAVLGTVLGVLLVMAAVCYYFYWVRQRRQRQWREVEMKQVRNVTLSGALEGSGSELAPRGSFNCNRQSSKGMSGALACAASGSGKGGMAGPQDVSRLADSASKGSFSSSRRLSPALLQVPEHNSHSFNGVREFEADINHQHLGHQRSSSSPQISPQGGSSSSTGGRIAQGPVAGSWTAGAADQHVSEASSGDAIALGLRRWSVAVSSTLRMMERGRPGLGVVAVVAGTWLGKRVAVKVMQLPASALLLGTTVAGDGQRLGQQFPHMAIVETVISRAMSHPNVVQVYTYMFNALKVEDNSVGSTAATTADASSGKSSIGQQQQQEDRVGCDTSARNHGNHGNHGVSGWELKLVMEYCDQGTLREALDRRRLQRGAQQKFLIPAIVLSLAHDVAAAMLHLHSEGVVHGDLKAGNVMLTKDGDDPDGVWTVQVGFKVTAKVADFGLAFPLDPNDTHATLSARGTPTHISPELFMAGHVSKASDVYAFGILLFEVITSQRAYPVDVLHRQHTCRVVAAATGSGSGSSELTVRLKEDMKVAMKAKDTQRLEAIRFLNAAIKQREIELRESSKQVTDGEVLSVIQKMAKQRKDSIEQYTAGGRQDLADKEQQELAVLESYLPAQLSREQVEVVVQAVVAEMGASSVKEMGKVMKAVQEKVAGQADNKTVSELVKAALTQQKT
eukprot:gene7113-7327_t